MPDSAGPSKSISGAVALPQGPVPVPAAPCTHQASCRGLPAIEDRKEISVPLQNCSQANKDRQGASWSQVSGHALCYPAPATGAGLQEPGPQFSTPGHSSCARPAVPEGQGKLRPSVTKAFSGVASNHEKEVLEPPAVFLTPTSEAVSHSTACHEPSQVAGPSRRSVDSLVCLEVFAGTARLSSALAAVGFQALAVDSRVGGEMRVLQVNLLQESGRQLVLDMIRSGKVWSVHLAPPCSTSSQARSIPARGRQAPVPLRSFTHPDGLPGLSMRDKVRVSRANLLYEFCAKAILAAAAAGCMWSVENPAGSLFWTTSPMKRVASQLSEQLCFVQFHHCCFGGDRCKLTALWTNVRDLSVLGMLCNPSLGHTHNAWGRLDNGSWATSAETAYPRKLCRQWAAALLGVAMSQGYSASDASGARANPVASTRARLRAALGFLPKSSLLPPQVNPLKKSEWVQLPPELDMAACVPGASAERLTGVKNSQVVSIRRQGGSWWASVAEPVQPQEFLRRAADSVHPAECRPPLPEPLESAVYRVRTSLTQVHRDRVQMLNSMCQRAKELTKEENEDHARMDSSVRGILEELLQSIDFDDKALVDDLRKGMPLTGWLRDSGHMQAHVVPPLLTKDELLQQAPARNREIWDMTGPSGDSTLDEALWRKTCEDVDNGWAFLLPPSDAPHRRFAVTQGDRVRAIDDFSVSRVNDTVGSQDKITVMTSGDTVALVQAFLRSPQVPARARKLLGRCFDLKSAYRQLAVSPQDMDVARVAVWNPLAKRVEILQLRALPFGASASVWGFIRLALALWAAGTQLLCIPWTTFYDDYSVVTLEEDVRSLQASVFLFFQLLGWKVATDGGKASPFCQVFQSLGVVFDLTKAPQRIVLVSNTEARRIEVRRWCKETLNRGTLAPAECLAFASRVRWLEAQTHGRLGMVALRVLLNHASPAKDSRRFVMSSRLRWAVSWILHSVPSAPPRAFQLQARKKFLVFTDGAVEDGIASVGGVLCSARALPIAYFGAKVPQSVTEAWRACGTEHPVFQAELLAVLLAAHLWGGALAGNLCTCFVDNEAVKRSLIRGSAFPDSNQLLLENFLSQESSLGTHFWFCRVPSPCNPADAPSRGLFPQWLACVKKSMGILWRLWPSASWASRNVGHKGPAASGHLCFCSDSPAGTSGPIVEPGRRELSAAWTGAQAPSSRCSTGAGAFQSRIAG